MVNAQYSSIVVTRAPPLKGWRRVSEVEEEETTVKRKSMEEDSGFKVGTV